MANSSSRRDHVIDYDKINELYLYPKKKEIFQKTKKKVENEEGTTFRPYIFYNKCSRNINSHFYERNEKFLKDKQNFIDLSIKEQNRIFNQKK